MKKGIIIVIISIILVFVFCIGYKLNVEKNSVLICIRDNNDKVAIKFNKSGIESMKINDKDVNAEDYILYSSKFLGKFTWQNMNEEDYSELELIRNHMKVVAEYEENNEEYNSVCDYK